MGGGLSRIKNNAAIEAGWERRSCGFFKIEGPFYGLVPRSVCSAALQQGLTRLESIGNTRINSGQTEFIIYEEASMNTG